MKRFISILFLMAFVLPAKATHNRAGEITYKHVSGLKYEITITTYTDISNVNNADRPYLELDWGDNTGKDSIQRDQKIDIVPGQVRKNVYTQTHTYPGPGAYTLKVEDPNRNDKVVNITNSVNIPFYIETELIISPFGGAPNTSPVLLNPPIDYACAGVIYEHNPAAYDADGDSLVFTLEKCRGSGGNVISSYQYPNQTPSANVGSSFSINAGNGTVTWDSPQWAGEYNFAIRVTEYRNGVKIGSILRDMQLEVVGVCNNTPPVINAKSELCVTAGDTISETINATDSVNDNITLTATGGPFQLGVSPAVFNPPPFPDDNVNGQFYWETHCAHIQKEPYQVFFRASDDGSPSLVDYHIMEVKVVGPAVENLTATPSGGNISLQWDKSKCNDPDNPVEDYSVYRRKGSYGFTPGNCETGVPAYTGYQHIGNTSSFNDNGFVDDNNGEGLIPGEVYCYMVVVNFTDGSESYASKEVCVEVKRDVPVITHVSVNSTSTSAGRMYVAWSKPTEHDTVDYPGPYRYLIRRSDDGSSYSLIDSTASINDTIYNDSLLNTTDNQYTYRVDIYNLSNGQRELMGTSIPASSVYLSSIPTDNTLILNWDVDVPWTNSDYVVYRYNENTSVYDSIATTSLTTYSDTGLVNGKTYCYQVKSIGGYTAPGITFPLINYSQEHCNEPQDTTAPCPPVISAEPECEHYRSLLRWTNPNNSCADDVVKYYLYYTADPAGEFKKIATIDEAADTTYLHEQDSSIAGCYAVTAIDTFENESNFSDTVCVDNCPLYELPNVFTPGGDGINDFYIPVKPYRYIQKIDLKIFNRWGQQVFKTEDPEIQWDGSNMSNGEPLSSGVYYYVCVVYEIRLEGITTRNLKGHIELIRNTNANSHKK